MLVKSQTQLNGGGAERCQPFSEKIFRTASRTSPKEERPGYFGGDAFG